MCTVCTILKFKLNPQVGRSVRVHVCVCVCVHVRVCVCLFVCLFVLHVHVCLCVGKRINQETTIAISRKLTKKLSNLM